MNKSFKSTNEIILPYQIKMRIMTGAHFIDNNYLVDLSHSKSNKSQDLLLNCTYSFGNNDDHGVINNFISSEPLHLNNDDIKIAISSSLSRETMERNKIDLDRTHIVLNVSDAKVDISKKGSRHAINLNIAYAIDDNSIVGGKTYVFVIVPNSLKSSSTSQVGGSKSSVDNIITQGISTFTGLNLENYRVGKPLYPCFNHIKFTVTGTEKQSLIKKIISLAAQSIANEESFKTNPSVQLCINKIKDNISYMNNSILPLGCSECVTDYNYNLNYNNIDSNVNYTSHDANYNNKSGSMVSRSGFNVDGDSSDYRETNYNTNSTFQYENCNDHDQLYLPNEFTPIAKRLKYTSSCSISRNNYNDSVHEIDNENLNTSKFKNVCGHTVKLLDNYCSQCGELVVIIDNSKCVACDFELTLSSRFCSNCGLKNVNNHRGNSTSDELLGSNSNQDHQESVHE
mmetsp:Transcript_6902/g.6205  ORF Transcript_6902/g.6205 Transcript_6902/m.6205 type:complete len:455 (-) Transcript_6902:49-1413(-)